MTQRHYDDAMTSFKKAAVNFIIEGSDWGE